MHTSVPAVAGIALTIAACADGSSSSSAPATAAAPFPPPVISATSRPAAPRISATSHPVAAIPTEAEAKAKIEASGFSNVGTLTQDTAGIWHGTATKDGMAVKVALDVQGNVKTE